ncbi:Hypothetical protein NTJ_07902 [Nesidiocoris tenuis]|uniref:PiggyBac transposable element-derived protein domain-containing protein n=1 Tax=Nesidiocoris tenuis TaxID=355587 RepID=A0ABN7AT10_9HEMI|nr:Hypothetical protein NTJ_07902 [Nesidiocoris tenuis]
MSKFSFIHRTSRKNERKMSYLLNRSFFPRFVLSSSTVYNKSDSIRHTYIISLVDDNLCPLLAVNYRKKHSRKTTFRRTTRRMAELFDMCLLGWDTRQDADGSDATGFTNGRPND